MRLELSFILLNKTTWAVKLTRLNLSVLQFRLNSLPQDKVKVINGVNNLGLSNHQDNLHVLFNNPSILERFQTSHHMIRIQIRLIFLRGNNLFLINLKLLQVETSNQNHIILKKHCKKIYNKFKIKEKLYIRILSQMYQIFWIRQELMVTKII
jgi:hypothetical protein